MRCFGFLVTLLHISSKTADDIVENNDQVILADLEAETFWVIATHDNDYDKKSWQDQVKIFSIMLNLSTTKKWKFVDLKSTYKKTHLCRFFNWFYVVMDSNLQLEFSNPSSNLGKKLVSWKPQPPPSLKI